MDGRLFVPDVGKVYRNVNGSEYICCRTCGNEAQFKSVVSGWTLTAHNVRLYDDGYINWDWSSSGYFSGEAEDYEY